MITSSKEMGNEHVYRLNEERMTEIVDERNGREELSVKERREEDNTEY